MTKRTPILSRLAVLATVALGLSGCTVVDSMQKDLQVVKQEVSALTASDFVPASAGTASPPRQAVAAQDSASSKPVRDLTIALWAGAETDGEGPLPRVREASGSGDKRQISGPYPWVHPQTGERMQVYKRINPTSRGEKLQLFAVTHGGAALGRVFDARPGQPNRSFKDDAFFPLGPWREGERRTFQTVEYLDGKPVNRTVEIRVKEVARTHKGDPDAMRYDWIMRDARGQKIYHEEFVYAPGKSLVRFRDRMG
ncbi:hypothetical protein [Futiania mangrovi]|uniref:Lipoprotein n=1 Tax=Futiania mangrovi TaxID=2959716 RepID=A0A9J6PFT7_9PROT|nr:hypothetical protein [Futiania mangrovii]MCP1335479.1 hypothetical protein [Futiania mangrovii]